MLNPVSTFERFTRVRRKSPAPIRSTSESATCETINALASGVRLATETTAPSFLQRMSSGQRAWHASAGAIPHRSAVATRDDESEPQHASVRRRRSAAKARSHGEAWPKARCSAHQASRTPKRASQKASNTFSVSICRIRRVLPAPNDMRTAISRSRVVARASERLAMLAQAMSKTRPTTAIRICNGIAAAGEGGEVHAQSGSARSERAGGLSCCCLVSVTRIPLPELPRPAG